MNKVFVGVIGLLTLAIVGVLIYGLVLNNQNQVKHTTVTIDDHKFTVEVADTDAKRQLGLSGRYTMKDDQGMLFSHEVKGIYGYWMKDMYFPIDIIWIDGDKIIDITKSVPLAPTNDELVAYYPYKPVDSVLEINANLSDLYGFKAGDIVKIDQ